MLLSVYGLWRASLTLGGELIKPEILKNAEIIFFLLEPFDVVYT